MRRGLILLLCSVVLPAWLGIVPVAAQQLNTYPGGIVDLNNTAVTVANTTTAGTLYSKTISPRYFQNLKQPLVGAAALHLKLLGTLTTNPGVGSAGNINVGCNYGGATASIALVNAKAPPQSLTNSPFLLDLWVRQQGTNTASEFVMGRLEIASVAGINLQDSATFMAATTGTTSVTANQTLTCAWLWGSAAATNSITVNSAVLSIGE
jgi:tryptophan-rich sensory protein